MGERAGKLQEGKEAACLASRETGKETAPCTHPDDHHLHGDVLRKVDGGPEVHGQGDEEVKDGHQVLPMDSFGWRGKKERPRVRCCRELGTISRVGLKETSGGGPKDLK